MRSVRRWKCLPISVLVAIVAMTPAAAAAASQSRRAAPLVPSSVALHDTVAAREASAALVASASPAVHVAPGQLFGYLPLDAFGIAPQAIGDEEILNFTVPSFVYNGATHNVVGVDSNGYIVVGGGTAADNNCCEPVVGSTAQPNGVLAPFWTDLDGINAPGIFAATLTDGVDSWVVVEWRVNVFGTNSGRTFQVWIGVNGSEDITYAYPGPLADPFGQPLVVGAENMDGTSGDSIVGPPTEDLRVTSDLVPPNSAPVANDEPFAATEDTTLNVPAPGVLANDTDADNDPLEAVLVAGPQHGTLSLSPDGSFVYTPAANYFGSDSFSYKATDGIDDSNVATVSIAVAAVNDLPTVTVAAGGSCGSNDRSGTLNLTVADVDNAAGSLVLSASSNNTALIPNANIAFAGSGANRTVTATAVSGKAGTAGLTITVSDSSQATGTVSISVKAGGNGIDTLTGGTGTDLMLGQNGDDTLSGLAGNDLLCGGAGNDTLSGGDGDDTIGGGRGADRFSGGAGTDRAIDLTASQGDTQDGTIP
jgi:VCBS repeat-containing protein